MGHLVAREPWGTVDLNTTEGRVWVQQNWLYTWTVNPGATAWTIAQKRHFHNTLDRQVWAGWSDRTRVRVAGAGDLARRFAAGGLRLTFDVHWVLASGHWSVRVRKLPAGSNPTTFISNVSFTTRQIELDSADLASYVPTNAAGASRTFRAAPHEFGHTFNNPDEYNAGSPNLVDTNSIMNIGHQVRPRHLTLLLGTLNRLVPGCVFSA
jgi:hypothetical protein